MKYSQQIGALIALLTILSCFFPWSYIPVLDTVITGMQTAGTKFGKPGILHIFFCSLAFILFLIPKLWSKRTNIFIAAMNLAWGLKNFMLCSMCSGGDCQQKRFGIYLVLVFSFVMIIMALLPKITVREKPTKQKVQ